MRPAAGGRVWRKSQRAAWKKNRRRGHGRRPAVTAGPAVLAAGAFTATVVMIAAWAVLTAGPVTPEEWRFFAALSCRGEFAVPPAELAAIRGAVPRYRRGAVERALDRTSRVGGR